MQIRVLFPNSEVKLMELEDYLLGVVPAEMIALWPLDALEAQAVAARTYALHKMLHGGKHKLQGADVCTTTHCQCYQDEPLYLPARRNQRAIDNVRQAVNETAGMVLTYDGKICDAVYHNSCGGGRTLNAKDVWGGEVPYLVSVECPCGEPKLGHGVGMCQYGARKQATLGNDWQGILWYYYTGAALAGVNEVVK